VLLLANCGRYHPDKNSDDPVASDKFQEVTFSYSILSDPNKRRQYDTSGFEVNQLINWSTVL
jgi:DnaJ-class molecular chaperone